jgi:DNA-3-methyladenine glycosylase
LKPLPRSFYLRPTVHVAHELLGKYFIRRIGRKLLIGKIVEVEAYRHNDPASHSYHGKTKRNSVMFCQGGHLYVYFTYGMHFCINIVTNKEGIGEAVLIRALEPCVGIESMIKNRSTSFQLTHAQSFNLRSFINLTNGPAKLCKAFGITRRENGLDLLNSNDVLIADGIPLPSRCIGTSSRIGIQSGLEKQWRFFIKDNPWVSK